MSKKPPRQAVPVAPCIRCGQFHDITQGNCWVCNFPGLPKVAKRDGLSPLWIFIITSLLVMGVIAASMIALFVVCIFAITQANGSFH